jgi:hypothetical protein
VCSSHAPATRTLASLATVAPFPAHVIVLIAAAAAPVSWFGAIFNGYVTVFLLAIGAPELSTFQLAATALAVPLGLGLAYKVSNAPEVTIPPSGAAAALGAAATAVDTAPATTQASGTDGGSPEGEGGEGGEAGADGAMEWSVELSMVVTSVSCFGSIAVLCALWVALTGGRPGARAALPLGMALLPLTSLWARSLGNGAPFVTTTHAQVQRMVQLATSAPAAVAAAEGKGEWEGELAELRLSQLQKRARAGGCAPEAIDAASDADEPKAALIGLILRSRPRPRAAPAPAPAAGERLGAGAGADGREPVRVAIGADLGSGDGRLAMALARATASTGGGGGGPAPRLQLARVHGFESNYLLVLYSRARVRAAGLEQRVQIHWRSMWEVDLAALPGRLECVTSYQHSLVMPRLEQKLRRELPRGARVVSNAFRFPSWVPDKVLPRMGGADGAINGEVLLYVQREPGPVDDRGEVSDTATKKQA